MTAAAELRTCRSRLSLKLAASLVPHRARWALSQGSSAVESHPTCPIQWPPCRHASLWMYIQRIGSDRSSNTIWCELCRHMKAAMSSQMRHKTALAKSPTPHRVLCAADQIPCPTTATRLLQHLCPRTSLNPMSCPTPCRHPPPLPLPCSSGRVLQSAILDRPTLRARRWQVQPEAHGQASLWRQGAALIRPGRHRCHAPAESLRLLQRGCHRMRVVFWERQTPAVDMMAVRRRHLTLMRARL